MLNCAFFRPQIVAKATGVDLRSPLYLLAKEPDESENNIGSHSGQKLSGDTLYFGCQDRNITILRESYGVILRPLHLRNIKLKMFEKSHDSIGILCFG